MGECRHPTIDYALFGNKQTARCRICGQDLSANLLSALKEPVIDLSQNVFVKTDPQILIKLDDLLERVKQLDNTLKRAFFGY